MFNLTRILNVSNKGASPQAFLVVAPFYPQQPNLFKVKPEFPVLESSKAEITNSATEPDPYNGLKPLPYLVFEASDDVANLLTVMQSAIVMLVRCGLTEGQKNVVREMLKPLNKALER